jgi:Mg-chelatase subunit ChlD
MTLRVWGGWISLIVMGTVFGCGDSGRADSGSATGQPSTSASTTGTGASTADMTGTGGDPTGGGTGTSNDPSGPPTTTVDPTGTTGDTTTTTTNGTNTTTSTTNGTESTTGEPPLDCKPPDALILLDRTQSMHRTPAGQTPVDAPAYASSKWAQAIKAIETLVAPPADGTLRFGLELWPRDPGGGQCITLTERITNSKMTSNPPCEAGEIAVEVGDDNGPAITDVLDPATTLLCNTTPTGTALYTAGEYLATIKEPDREQYAVLVTDGADWDFSCPDPSPLAAVQDLADQGVQTFIIGFSGEEAQMGAIGYLNNLACAGQTAKGFPGPCVATADGFVAAPGNDKIPVYLQADDGDELGKALVSVASELCCGCEKTCDPPEVLFALDRTQSMHRTPDGQTPVDAPDYASSKWSQAITAIEAIADNGLDSELRLGLELWPLDPGGGQCITLEERILNTKMTSNPACQVGEIVVPPALDSGKAITQAIDPKTTLLCNTTPTGSALDTAGDWLVANAIPGRDQYIVLVTDGADWDFSCPNPSPLLVTQQFAAAGIRTYVVGFFGAEAQMGALAFLNDMACAGQTATDFEQNCVHMGSGYKAKDPMNPKPLYLQAGNGELQSKLQTVVDEILQFCTPG